MDVYEIIKKRRSIRKYLDVPIEWDKISLILDAAKSASSAGNLQGWRFLIVKNKETIRKLADAALHQLWMETAPVVIVVCSDESRYKKYYGSRGEKLYSIQDTAMAVQNIIIMAEAQELGSCFVGAFEEEAVKRALKIPEEMKVQALITIGHPDEKPPQPAKLHLRDVVYFETYFNKVRHKGIWPLEKHLDKGKEAIQVYTAKAVEKGKEVVDKVKDKVQKVKETKLKEPHEKEESEIPSPPKQTAFSGISDDVLNQIKALKKKKE